MLLHAPFMQVTHTPNLVGFHPMVQEDSITDGDDYNIPFAFLKKHGDNYFAHFVQGTGTCLQGRSHSALLECIPQSYQYH